MDYIFSSILIITFLIFPILGNIASNRLNFLFEDKYIKDIGFELEERTWGLTYGDSKKVYKLSKTEFIKKKAKQSIRLWDYSFLGLLTFLILLFIKIFLG